MAQVLIVEDEPNIAMVLQELLVLEGHEVSLALDGQEGMRKLRQGPDPDIVLVDLLMPGLTGRSIIEAMRGNPRWQRIPAVIITGSIPRTDAFPSKGSYQALIRKPFDLTEVVETVEQLLRRPRVVVSA